ncbi:nuclear transport factor 2 family protein [Bradyrhizobium sp. SSUT18]|uniref:nuclear transport factor 2 family protein n=1 Tax=unclassified Bradyrhizobium TaxID=2631580 RepID=UPI002446DC4A|nr:MULTISPECIES: nuclear transport factor 2 family protein [unclassified Bradyrhizobium]MDH2346830.1 nuclear transport factor 2 family protein [Bradyrhizobium sp. SSUT77]MDH2351229.1 nuclear transport factor 2 family protein [Bradyrhizobium sp. SSUT112]MDH2405325.1 nuclear transport factor 2 family protein [Bradyrhizobium sp. SSUT18]
MPFDPMAVAIDWLDAYRAGDIEAILDMFAEDAVVHCGCCGNGITIASREALRAYWVDRLREHPAGALDDLNPSDDGTIISYVTRTGVMHALFAFDDAGRIKKLDCNPSHQTAA